MGSHHKKKKGTDDSRIIIADIKKDTDQDAIRTVLQTGLEVSSPGVPRMPQARAVIDYINVTETTDPAQSNAPAAPAQVTGLSVTPISNSQLNLAWTVSGSPNIANYKVYRDSSNIASPVPNSYSDTGLTAGTTYAYNVSAVNTSTIEGALSSTVNGTTTGSAPITPSLELHLDGDYTDTSPNALVCHQRQYASPVNGFSTGQFSQGCLFNTPINPSPKESLKVDAALAIQMDVTIGFSFSCWINPLAITAAPGYRRQVVGYAESTGDFWSLEIDPNGKLYFFVFKSGVTYQREITVTVGAFQHIAATFNGATNTAALYKNAVAGIASSAGFSQIRMDTTPPLNPYMFIGAKFDPPDSTYFQGTMDEIRYYKSRVLTPTQVTNLMNTNSP